MAKQNRGSVTLLSLCFLLLISAVIGYRMVSYQDQIMANHSLINNYSARIRRSLK